MSHKSDSLVGSMLIGKREGPDHGDDQGRGEAGRHAAQPPGQDQPDRRKLQQVSSTSFSL